jgi:hypothetical protein
MDQALTPVVEDEFDSLEMFTVNDAAKSAVTKSRGVGHVAHVAAQVATPLYTIEKR